MSNRYNIAIVGTGRIIKAHVSAIKEIPCFNIAGVYGRDFSRAKDTAFGLGLKAFKEYDEILNDPEVHVVDIANSSDLHAQYGIEAAKHRKNLII
ncbi:MAG: Gfo/Idh/MocA family oxidoreductase, partial [Deltaproteobacteria bacterium]|nr:Gfo/Idh/MocA family oxidoreductase [Deltaproteobacteria bacterium]